MDTAVGRAGQEVREKPGSGGEGVLGEKLETRRKGGRKEKRGKAVSCFCSHAHVRVDLFRDMKLIIYYKSDFPEKLQRFWGFSDK